MMKMLVTSFPGFGHFLPVVPLAWAARAAGHEVLVVSTGQVLEASERAGLSWADAAPGGDIITAVVESMKDAEDKYRDSSNPAGAAEFMSAISSRMADRTLEIARAWKPDVIVHTPTESAGVLAASLLSVPAVSHGFGIASIGKTGMIEMIYEAFRPACERNGWKGELVGSAANIDTCPPSMREPDRPDAWYTRYIPFNGGGRLPDEYLAPSSKRRICVTLGTVIPYLSGVGGLGGVVEAVRDLDAEVILALGGTDPSALGTLPPNVRTVGWTPLSTLLPTCSAVVHHGGAGTTMNAIVAGVPQLILPHGADQHINAAAVRQRGAGLSMLPEEASAETVRHSLQRLLDEPGFTQASQEVSRENESQTPPSEIVPRLLALAGRS
ncbi:nucleotide disphospho-sugar-binding domain-containing protein [Paenibacillus humicola]|uniref:nucleotide disphospho-sugar-binding domain-containing protein n=1 Tax=Paenibacillus humicola TaxID=3110540 RepID=UPI00237B8ABB|nr:nucleotide disphospho-sugar-binding domain-containing protein [Paenibacillus humicola]